VSFLLLSQDLKKARCKRGAELVYRVAQFAIGPLQALETNLHHPVELGSLGGVDGSAVEVQRHPDVSLFQIAKRVVDLCVEDGYT